MRAAVVIITLALVAFAAANRTFDRCSLARELYYSHGVPWDELDKWTCIAEHESSFRTWVVGPPNGDGSSDYGLFQVNDLYWCQPPNGRFSYNACYLSCNSLLTDDITDSVNCARKVKNEQGWGAWAVWYKCSGWLPNIGECF